MSAIILDEKMVHYEVLGRGRPIIFLHGWVGSWRYWIPCMQTVAVSFRAYALDLWGFGDSAKEPSKYSLEKQASLVDHFLQAMGIGKVAIIGHGLGALVAFHFTRLYPSIVDRLMLVNVPFDNKMASERLRRPASPADLADWLLGKNHMENPARLDASKADPLSIINSFASLEADSYLPLLESITTPCLIVHGQNDPAVQTLDYDRIQGMRETLHQVVLENSGHFPMLDENAKFNRLMADFLALGSGESPRDLQLKEEWKRRVR